MQLAIQARIYYCYLYDLFLKKYKDIEGVVKIEEVNGEELVKRFAEEMEEMLGRKMKSVKVTCLSFLKLN